MNALLRSWVDSTKFGKATLGFLRLTKDCSSLRVSNRQAIEGCFGLINTIWTCRMLLRPSLSGHKHYRPLHAASEHRKPSTCRGS